MPQKSFIERKKVHMKGCKYVAEISDEKKKDLYVEAIECVVNVECIVYTRQ